MPDALPVATPFSRLLRHAGDTVAQFLPRYHRVTKKNINNFKLKLPTEKFDKI